MKRAFTAFADDDRDTIESLIADDFTFSSPDDPQLDRAGFFERCWPGAGGIEGFESTHVFTDGDEVLLRYIATRKDGTRFRNVELFHVRDGQITDQQVYYGIDID